MRINDENKSVDMEARDINFILPPYVRSYLFYAKNEMPTKIVFPMFASVDVIGADRQPVTIPIEWVSPESPIAKGIAEDGEAVAEVTPEQETQLDEKDEQIKELKAEFVPVLEDEKVDGLTEEEEAYEAAKADQATPAPEDILRQQQETIQQLEDETADLQLEVDTEEPPASPARAAFAESEPIPASPEIEGTPEQQVSEAEEIGLVKPEPEQPTPPSTRVPKQPPGGDIGPGSPPSDMHPRDSRDQVRTTRDLLEEPDITEAEEKPFEKEISRGEDGKPVVEDKPDE